MFRACILTLLSILRVLAEPPHADLCHLGSAKCRSSDELLSGPLGLKLDRAQAHGGIERRDALFDLVFNEADSDSSQELNLLQKHAAYRMQDSATASSSASQSKSGDYSHNAVLANRSIAEMNETATQTHSLAGTPQSDYPWQPKWLGPLDGVLWWQPDDFASSLTSIMLSCVLFGSWMNFQKGAGHSTSVMHFYIDCCIGSFIVAACLYLGPGGRAVGYGKLTEDIRIIFIAAAGLLNGFGMLMLTIGVSLAGLGIAPPICSGVSLILGTMLSYIVDQRGKLVYIFLGVLLAFCGINFNALAFARKLRSQPREAFSLGIARAPQAVSMASSGLPVRRVSRDAAAEEVVRSTTLDLREENMDVASVIVICIFSGVLMAASPSINFYSMAPDLGVNPYFDYVIFSAASLMMAFVNLVLSQFSCLKWLSPKMDDSFESYINAPVMSHGWGLAAGVFYGFGVVLNYLGGQHLGFALAFAIGMTSPVVAIVWSVAFFREFDGVSIGTMMCLLVSIGFYVGALILLVNGIDLHRHK